MKAVLSIKTFPILTILIGLAAFRSGGASEQAAPVELDLTAAIEAAVSNNLKLARDALSIAQAEISVRKTATDFSIKVRPDGSASVSSDNNRWQGGLALDKKLASGAEVSLSGQVRESIPQSDEDENTWRTSVRVDISQPLFGNFGPLIHLEPLRSANDQLTREQRSWELQKTELVLDVITTFETIISLERQVLSDETFFQRTDRLYRLTLARERQGRATRVDTLRVELQRGQALARLENNRERIYSLQQELAELTGFPQDTLFDLEPAPLPDIPVPEPEAAILTALSNRLDYAQVLHDYSQSLRRTQIARRKVLPDINLLIGAEQYGEDNTFADSAELDSSQWMVGLSGASDILRREQRLNLQSAQLDQESLAELIRIKSITITREVLQAISSYRRRRTEVEIEQRNYALADNRVRLARRMYEAGRVDNFSVTDAEDAYIKAEVKLLTARANHVIAGYVLLKQLGTLIDYPAPLKSGALEI
jgi:outer membrane protein TolC